jgi:hypothetical protein
MGGNYCTMLTIDIVHKWTTTDRLLTLLSDATTLSIMTFSKMTFDRIGLIVTLCINDIQHK